MNTIRNLLPTQDRLFSALDVTTWDELCYSYNGNMITITPKKNISTYNVPVNIWRLYNYKILMWYPIYPSRVIIIDISGILYNNISHQFKRDFFELLRLIKIHNVTTIDEYLK
ncbi:MAG: hypothetical protein H3C45_04370 [Bacteroidia bacterium]|nr:hypothetical protein [Bacteroidia bacterium]